MALGSFRAQEWLVTRELQLSSQSQHMAACCSQVHRAESWTSSSTGKVIWVWCFLTASFHSRSRPFKTVSRTERLVFVLGCY